MRVYEKGNRVFVEELEHFNPVHTFECGQCFRWEAQEDGSYLGVAHGRVIHVKMDNTTLILTNTNLEDYNHIWKQYFDFERDYGSLKGRLSKDLVMKNAIEFGWGMRILNQDVWECLISFIISSNNTIPRIKKIIKNICQTYGQPLQFNDNVYYSFPEPETLYGKTLEDLAFCRSGYRCKFILDAARFVVENDLSLESLRNQETEAARKTLMEIKGVGQKVADCVLLFSLQKDEVFPTDVWVKRVVEYFYFGEETRIQEIHAFAREHFGNLAGLAQQYLFYYAREKKLGK